MGKLREGLSCNLRTRTLWHMRPTKIQISLCMRAVWSKYSLSAWRNFAPFAFHYAPSKDSDQYAQMCRLIWIFAGRRSGFRRISEGGVRFNHITALYVFGQRGLSEQCRSRSDGAERSRMDLLRSIRKSIKFIQNFPWKWNFESNVWWWGWGGGREGVGEMGVLLNPSNPLWIRPCFGAYVRMYVFWRCGSFVGLICSLSAVP